MRHRRWRLKPAGRAVRSMPEHSHWGGPPPMRRRPMVRMMADKPADPKRLAAWRRGRWSEALCRLALRLKGYRILARGWRCPQGEIDIVARRGGTVAIVEVKARRTLDAAGSALSAHQRRRLEHAAATFVARHPGLTR